MLPNFLIIGAAKSGTTSLYYYLKQHPDIFMPSNKEPSFFDHEKNLRIGNECSMKKDIDAVKSNTITNYDEYSALFDNATTETVFGEASPVYLYSTKAALTIKKYIPNAKLIAILRNPVERAFSNYSHFVRSGSEPKRKFRSALDDESRRIEQECHWFRYYIRVGFYAEQLKRYYDNFPSNQIKIILFDDLRSDPVPMIKSIFEYLEIDNEFQPKNIFTKYNVSGVARSKRFHNWLLAVSSGNSTIKKVIKYTIKEDDRKRLMAIITELSLRKKESISLDVRKELIEVYREDILCLQDMIDRNLSHWITI